MNDLYTEGSDDNFVYHENNHAEFKITTTIESVFNFTTLFLFVGFLAIYFILFYAFQSAFGSNSTNETIKSHTINVTIITLLLAGFIYFYATLSPANQSDFFNYTMALFKDEMNDPNTIVIMTVFLLLFYIFVFIMNFPMGKDTKPFTLEIIEFKSWVYLVMLLFISVIIYGFHFEIVDWFYYQLHEAWKKMSPSKNDDHAKSSPSPAKSPTKNMSPTTNVNQTEEVFNIGNNLYTYEDAQSICTAYGARLATYDDMEKAYQDGGEWCNYGWSDGQMIFYPTQKDTWQKLQKDPKTKHNCGRPGINGGFMANPYVKFGVNCYGLKPKPKEIDKDMMKRKLISPTGDIIPSPEQIDPKVQKWKSMLNTLTVNSYNNKEWSEYDKNKPMSVPTLVPISNYIQPSAPSTVSNASPAFISTYLPSSVTVSSPAPTPVRNSAPTTVRSPTGF